MNYNFFIDFDALAQKHNYIGAVLPIITVVFCEIFHKEHTIFIDNFIYSFCNLHNTLCLHAYVND